MITIHSLAYSRAIRLIWLMEDLKQPYSLIMYNRTESYRAPDSLKQVHPLGKSPVIEDGDLLLTESATCLRYLTKKFDDNTHRPNLGTVEYVQHEELLDYVESSFAEIAMKLLIPKLSGQEPSGDAITAMQMHYGYIAQQLTENDLLFGDVPMLADIQLSYLLATLSSAGLLEHERLAEYWTELQKLPGYQAAIAKAGPMAPTN